MITIGSIVEFGAYGDFTPFPSCEHLPICEVMNIEEVPLFNCKRYSLKREDSTHCFFAYEDEVRLVANA